MIGIVCVLRSSARLLEGLGLGRALSQTMDLRQRSRVRRFCRLRSRMRVSVKRNYWSGLRAWGALFFVHWISPLIGEVFCTDISAVESL